MIQIPLPSLHPSHLGGWPRGKEWGLWRQMAAKQAAAQAGAEKPGGESAANDQAREDVEREGDDIKTKKYTPVGACAGIFKILKNHAKKKA